MVEYFFDQRNVIFQVSFYGPIIKEDIDKAERAFDILLVEHPQPITVHIDTSKARVVDSSLIYYVSDCVKRNQSYCKKIVVYGMSPFLKILYSSYLKLTSLEYIHEVVDEPSPFQLSYT